MSQGYKEELQEELQKTDPNLHSSRLLAQEIERLEKGEDAKEKKIPFIEIHPDHPQNVALRIRIPVKDYPKFNFVGKLLGPKGNTLKRLQEETGCKLAVLGKGSMKDKAKEDELRKEGGAKFAHLNDELHIYVEAFAEMSDSYRRISHAVQELKKFLIPVYDDNDEIRQQQMEEMMYLTGGEATRGSYRGGRGAVRGGPPPRGAPRGGGAPPPRGGAPPPRGGAPPPSRGAPPMRGSSRPHPSAPPSSNSYEGYSGGYSSSHRPSAYEDSYDRAYSRPSETTYSQEPSRESHYYGSSYSSGAAPASSTYDDYHRSSAYDEYSKSSSSYDRYGGGSSYDDYARDSWATNGSAGGPIKSAPPRGAAMKPRSHPYTGSRGY